MNGRLLLVAFLMVAAQSAGAQMYKCVDERGVTHYSDKPRTGCQGGEVDIAPIPPVSGTVTPYREDLKAAERDFRRRQIARGREEEAEMKRLAQLKQRCASLNLELQRYTNARRIDDNLREEKLRQLNAEIAQKCR